MKTILVVDDQTSAGRLLQQFLQEQGFRVIFAADGQDALRQARQAAPDLILLDIRMPDMDGFEFLRKLRPALQTPVILVTSQEAETDIVRGFELGADDFLIRPFRMHELVARIHAILRRKGKSDIQMEARETARP